MDVLCVGLVRVHGGEDEEALGLGLGAIRGPVELGPKWLWALALPRFRVPAVRGRGCWACGTLIIRLGVEERGKVEGRSV